MHNRMMVTAQSTGGTHSSQNPKSSLTDGNRFALFRDDFQHYWGFETLSEQRLVSVKPPVDVTEIGRVAESI
jgi:hypothetical protein